MIKPFVLLSFLLLLMMFTMGLHYVLYPHTKTTDTLHSMTALIHMSSLSLSVYYDESTHNSTYPEMPALGRMDFVYER